MAARRPYGTGTLRERKDSAGRAVWYGQWRAHGRQVQRRIGLKRSEGGHDGLTRRQAEAELRRLISTASTQRAPERRTLRDVAPEYVDHLEAKGRKRSTIVAVRSALDCWLLPVLGDRTLDRVRQQDVENLMALMRAGSRPWAPTRRKPVGAKSIRNYVGTLGAIYAYAIRKGHATTNPVANLDLPTIEQNEDIRFLEPVEVQAAAAAAVAGPYQSIDRALYLTAAMTGLREGELIALRWRDVDWRAGRVRVRQNYVLDEFGTPKSRRSTRSVPMADQVGGELDRLYQASRKQGDGDLVFADPLTGQPLSKAAILRRFRRALKAARLDTSHTFHHLRHTFGTHMAATGMPMRTLQELMGHRDLATTQRYADYAPSAQEAAYVAAAFGTPASPSAASVSTT
jgi:integrase